MGSILCNVWTGVCVMNKQPTPRILLAAIRANCLECCGGSRKQVRNCEIKHCKLWPYRMGEDKAKKPKVGAEKYKQITVFDLMEVQLNDKD